jgi:hypothetical protein
MSLGRGMTAYPRCDKLHYRQGRVIRCMSLSCFTTCVALSSTQDVAREGAELRVEIGPILEKQIRCRLIELVPN